MDNQRLGWETIPEIEFINYLTKLKILISDDFFQNFRRDPDYGKILSGDPYIIGEHAIDNLKTTNNLTTYLNNKIEISRNDIIGNPYIYNYSEIGDANPSTLMYYSTVLKIQELINNQKLTNIVEIGGGYGGLCRLVHSFIGFDNYILIDLPDAIVLAKKYLDNYHELSHKITYISCDNLEKLEIDICLTIANSSLAELDFETQKKYLENIFLNSKFGHIIWNTNHIPSKVDEMNFFIEKLKNNNKIVENIISHSNISNLLIKSIEK